MTEPSLHAVATERLVLRLPRPDDAAALADYYVENREHLAPWSPPYPDGFFEEGYWRGQVPAMHDDARAGRAYRFVLFERGAQCQPVLGTVGLTQVARGPFQACYLGYGIGKTYERRGLMYEALEAVIGYAFEGLLLHRVMANYVPTNERSGRLLRRLGFVVEGYARDYLYIGGAWRDHVLTSLTNPALERPES